MWMNPLYDTRDKIIPARLFDVLAAGIPHLEARAHLLIKQGVASGYATARSEPNDPTTRHVARVERQLAFPIVPPEFHGEQ